MFVVFANQFKAKCVKFSRLLRLYVLKLQMLLVSTYSLYMMYCIHMYNGYFENQRASLAQIQHSTRHADNTLEMLEFDSASKMPYWSMPGCHEMCIVTIKR